MLLEIARLNRDFQDPGCLFDETIASYEATLGSDKPVEPIEVYSDGESFWLFDGFHRVAAAERIGIQCLEANITPGTFADMQAKWNEGLAAILADLRKH